MNDIVLYFDHQARGHVWTGALKSLCFSSHGIHSVFCARRKAPHSRLYRMFYVDMYLHHVPACAWVSFIGVFLLCESRTMKRGSPSLDVSWEVLSELCMQLWELIRTAAKHTRTHFEGRKNEKLRGRNKCTCISWRPESRRLHYLQNAAVCTVESGLQSLPNPLFRTYTCV